MSTPLDLDAIKARAEAATEGPWEAHALDGFEWSVDRIGDNDDDSGNEVATVWVTGADAAFIAHARTDVPMLLAELERLRALNTASAE